MDIKYCGITATKNRHSCLERLVTCFLKQDYAGQTTLVIFNNAPSPLKLDASLKNIPNKKIILVNNHISYVTKSPYTNLGDIYLDLMIHVPKDTDVISVMDDDDIFLYNYVSQGVEGFNKAGEMGKVAYKPKKSFYKDSAGLHFAENVFEPSIFVDYEHVMNYGFNQTNVDSHHKWLNPLVENDGIFVDPAGIPTFIYDWSGQIPTFKTSGNPNNPQNFQNYANWSKDVGDGIISPISDEAYNYYTKLQ